MSTFSTSRIFTAGTLLALTMAVGCSSEPTEEEPEVETMRLVIETTTGLQIGLTTVNFAGGTCTPSPSSVTIPTAGATVTASFLRADGTPETIVTADEFELQVTPAGRFTRTGAFTGTIAGGTAGSASLGFALLHKIEQHEDFGPCNLTVTVQ